MSFDDILSNSSASLCSDMVARTVMSLAVVTTSAATATLSAADATSLASEVAQLIHDVEHHIAVHCIVLPVAPAVGTQLTGEIALLTKKVIELESCHKTPARQYLLGYLGIPYHFSGVVGGIIVASAHTLVDARVDGHVPRQADIEGASV